MNNHNTSKTSQNPTSATRRPASGNQEFELNLVDRLDHSLMAAHGRASDWAAIVGRGVTR